VILLDTHVLVWLTSEREHRIPARVREAVVDEVLE